MASVPIRVWVAVTLLVLLREVSVGAEAASLTNEDIRTLTKAGLPADVIVAKIESSETAFDTSVDELVSLTKDGVDATVLKAMASVPKAPPTGTPAHTAVAQEIAVRTAATAAANVRTNFGGTPCPSPGIFLEKDGELHDVDITTTAQTRTGGGILSGVTYGIVSTKSKAAINGAHAMLRATTQTPVFWFCFEETQAGLSYQTAGAVNPSEFLLVSFKVSKRRKERTFEVGKFNVWTGSQSGTPPKQLRDVAFDKAKPGVFKVTPVEPLVAGEYGFYYAGNTSLAAFGFLGVATMGSKIFAFGVD